MSFVHTDIQPGIYETMIQQGPSNITPPVKLPSILNSAAAPGLLDVLLAHRTDAIRLDGGLVQRLGGQCLQILLATHAYAVSENLVFTISPMSDELASMLQLFGVAPDLFSQEQDCTP